MARGILRLQILDSGFRDERPRHHVYQNPNSNIQNNHSGCRFQQPVDIGLIIVKVRRNPNHAVAQTHRDMIRRELFDAIPRSPPDVKAWKPRIVDSWPGDDPAERI